MTQHKSNVFSERNASKQLKQLNSERRKESRIREENEKILQEIDILLKLWILRPPKRRNEMTNIFDSIYGQIYERHDEYTAYGKKTHGVWKNDGDFHEMHQTIIYGIMSKKCIF